MGEKKSKIKLEIILSKNANITYQTVLDTTETELRGTFIILYAYIRKEKIPQIKNVSFHIKN